MTEMVHGAIPTRVGEPLLPKWWRTIDRWSLLCVLALFGIGLLLGLAASPPLAERNGLDPFYYVTRQAAFGLLALVALLACSMMTPQQLRRFGVIGFALAFVALALLPVFGTNFGKGAIRWYSLGFGSVQPSEFLKPFYVVLAGWLMAAGQDVRVLLPALDPAPAPGTTAKVLFVADAAGASVAPLRIPATAVAQRGELSGVRPAPAGRT